MQRRRLSSGYEANPREPKPAQAYSHAFRGWLLSPVHQASRRSSRDIRRRSGGDRVAPAGKGLQFDIRQLRVDNQIWFWSCIGMARPLRHHFAGGWYPITARGMFRKREGRRMRVPGAGCCLLRKWSGQLNPSGANTGMNSSVAMAITGVTLRYI